MLRQLEGLGGVSSNFEGQPMTSSLFKRRLDVQREKTISLAEAFEA